MRRLLCACAIASLAACSPKPATPPQPAASAPAPAPAPVTNTARAGDYTLDKAHTSLTFEVSHMGFSNYTAQFKKLDGKLHFDPANPASSSISVTIDPRSLDVNAPPAGFVDQLLGPQWLDAAHHPEITYSSTNVELTGPNTARVTGDFTLHGVTKPVILDVKFNGGYDGKPVEPGGRVGFSAHGAFKRSDFGIAYGVPAPGSNLGVSDTLEVQIESEFNGPPRPGETPAVAPGKSQ
ncbi:MAG TPA: YceI family protein [Caulobacteraceae bacterium]|nr:YceI family protein [Caulobacteraceae bacterium]